MLLKELLKSIKHDHVHGATELALIAIDGVREIVQQTKNEDLIHFEQSVRSLIVDLQNCRPSMAALNNLLQKILTAVSDSAASNVDIFKSTIVNSCEDVTRFAQNAQSLAVQNMVSLIAANDVIMTHSISSTVKKVCVCLQKSRPTVRLIVTESRPGDEGKLLAAFLSELGLHTTYITEAQIDLHMPEVSKVVVGADAVLADGSIINKCGTNLMALSARYHSVPFYVCAESFKQKSDNEYELEQMSGDELKLELASVKLSNIYFEHLPLELITRWIR